MADLPRLTLVLGGARSGKSSYAERLMAEAGLGCVYVATAEAWDDEMRERITRHRAGRPAGWTTIEAPLDLADALVPLPPERPVLVDCLTLWLSNVMLAERDVAAESDGLIAALAKAAPPVVCVSNEVGLGIVPDNALARRFRDAQGTLNQRVAAQADRVVLMTAGQALVFKDAGTTLGSSLPLIEAPQGRMEKPPRHQDTKEEISRTLDEIARSAVDCAFKVHTTLGPGLLETVYESCLAHELEARGHTVLRQVPVPVVYGELRLSGALRIDLLVDNALIIEVKAAERPNPLFDAQVLTYLKLTERRLGLLINFNVPRIKDGIKRLAR